MECECTWCWNGWIREFLRFITPEDCETYGFPLSEIGEPLFAGNVLSEINGTKPFLCPCCQGNQPCSCSENQRKEG